MTKHLDIPTAAKLLGKTPRHIRRMCIAGTLAGAKKNGGRWAIPITANTRLRGITMPEDVASHDDMLKVSAAKREVAIYRFGMIQEFEKFSASVVQTGGDRMQAFAMFSQRSMVSSRSIQRWIKNYRLNGLMGLVDSRGGALTADSISPEAFDQFKTMYLTPQQLSVKLCYDSMCFLNTSQKRDWKIPSLRMMYEVVKVRIPAAVEVLHREGMAAYEAKFAPYIQTDPDSVGAGEVFIGDHHKFNCWVRHRGKWIRPWITAWEDMRSRVIVGYCITASPNQTTIMLAMKRAIEKYGPPDSVKIDNGRDYDSEMWTGVTKKKRLKAGYIDETNVAGIYAMMGIGVSFSIPYHPQSKAIERFFDTLDIQFTKTIPTYCGKDSARKPEKLNNMLSSKRQIDKAYTVETFTELVDRYIKLYNSTAHSGNGMDGRSPAEVILTRRSRRVLADGVLELLMQVWSGELKVGKNGVRFKGLYYGQFSPELLAYQGKMVRLAYDPDDITSVQVYDAATRKLITIAEQTRLVAYGDKVSEEHVREAMKKKAQRLKVVKQFNKTSRVSQMDLTELTLQAKADATRADQIESEGGSIRPVPTLFDGQVGTIRNRRRTIAVRKAAGAEGLSEVPDLQFDFSSTKNNADTSIDLGFYDD